MFKKGDIVECINRGGYRSIELGETYEVLSVSSDNRFVEIFLPQAKHQNYYCSRFKLVETKMSDLQKKREELEKALDLVTSYGIRIANMDGTIGYYGKTLGKQLSKEGVVLESIPDPKQDEIERIESEMRKLADDLAKLKG